MKNKRVLIFALIGVLILFLVACGNGDDKPQEDTEVEEIEEVGEESGEGSLDIDYENMTAEELLDEIVEDQENLKGEEFLLLLESYKYVDMDEDFERESNITNEAFRILREDGNFNYDLVDEVLEEAVGSPVSIVRGEIVQYLQDLFGVGDKYIDIMMEMAETEEEEYVLASMISVLANEMKNPDVAEFIFRMSEHENHVIRRRVANALGSSWSEGVEGAIERLMEMMDEEENESVRKALYSNAGKQGDERVLDQLVAVLMDPEQSEYHGDCMKGISDLWIHYPFYEHTNEDAYRAVIDYLEYTPRSEDMPKWVAISYIDSPSDGDKYEAWLAKATYYDPDELVAAATEILKDPDTDWMASTSAIKLIKDHGTREQLEALGAIIEETPHPKKSLILSSYENTLED